MDAIACSSLARHDVGGVFAFAPIDEHEVAYAVRFLAPRTQEHPASQNPQPADTRRCYLDATSAHSHSACDSGTSRTDHPVSSNGNCPVEAHCLPRPAVYREAYSRMPRRAANLAKSRMKSCPSHGSASPTKSLPLVPPRTP